jgi:hypothetical protein
MDQEAKSKSTPTKERRSVTKLDVQQFLLRGRAFIALILKVV